MEQINENDFWIWIGIITFCLGIAVLIAARLLNKLDRDKQERLDEELSNDPFEWRQAEKNGWENKN